MKRALALRADSRGARYLDGTVIDEHEYRTRSEIRKFAVWSADNGALLGRE